MAGASNFATFPLPPSHAGRTSLPVSMVLLPLEGRNALPVTTKPGPTSKENGNVVVIEGKN
jgi:hypothetical protein